MVLPHIHMKIRTLNIFFLGLLTTFYVIPHGYVFANEESTRFNNQNWQISEQPVVWSFTTHTDGSFSGLTTDGIPFTQYTVSEVDGIKVQRFEIEDHYHFIVNGEVAYSLEVLSSILSHKGQTSSIH